MIGKIFFAFFIALTAIWTGLAFFYTSPFETTLSYIFLSLFISLTFFSLYTIFVSKLRRVALGLFVSTFFLVLLNFYSIKPSNDKNWQKDVALLPYSAQKDNLITIYNIRNFKYKSEFEYTPKYYDKTYDLDKLEGIDLIAVYWMGPSIAHIFLSFSFGENEKLAISIETRKEVGEEYSTFKGFFRQYELYYVVGDENDLIGLRTNFRDNPKEDVYIYPLTGSKQTARKLFLEYVKKINTLKNTPEFYNTLTTNCTTAIWENESVSKDSIPFSWKILASGYLPKYLYEQGVLKSDALSFEELKKKAYANERAQKVTDKEFFSSQIRGVEQ